MPSYVIADLNVSKLSDESGRTWTVAEILSMRAVEGERPISAIEIEGCNPEVLATINDVCDGRSQGITAARVGVGVSPVLEDITKLHWSSDIDILERLREKVPGLFDKEGNIISRQGLVCLFRTGLERGTFWCADACAGGAETTAIDAEAYREMVEVGFYTSRNAIGRPFVGKGYQDIVDAAARDTEWLRRITGFSPYLTEHIMVHEWLTPPMYDRIYPINNPSRPMLFGALSAEPSVGSIEIILPLLLRFPEYADKWYFCDTEHMKVKGDDIALNRRPILIVPIEGQAPVMLGFGPDGIDPSGTIAYLEGSNLEMMINGKVKSVLRALGWLLEQ